MTENITLLIRLYDQIYTVVYVPTLILNLFKMPSQ